MTNRSSTTSTTSTAAATAPVLGVGGGRDHRRDHETNCRDTKADCEHGNLSTRPGRLSQRASAFFGSLPEVGYSSK
jgi:hypothetical protein